MTIKFLQLNVWFGGMMFDEIVMFLKREQPDIVTMQEVYDGRDEGLERRFRTVVELTRALEYPYHAFAPEYPDAANQNIELGNLILSKFPIIRHESVFYDTPYGPSSIRPEDAVFAPRNLQHCLIDLRGKTLHVFNTHGIWDSNGLDNPRRLAMSDTIIRETRGKQPLILAGDFNARAETQSIKNIEKHLINVFRNELTTSFNLKQKGSAYATAVVDFIFVSPDARVVEHRVLDANVSDHLPLLAVCEIPF